MGLNSLIKKVETRSEDISDGRYVANAINEVTEKLFTEGNRKPSTYFTPSSIGNCERQNYYKVTGAPIDKKLDVVVKNCKKAYSGTDRHERIQNKLMNAERFGFNIKWVDIAEFIRRRGYDYLEIKGNDGTEYHLIDHRYGLSFKVDGLLRVKSRYMIAEIKTDDTYRFSRRNGISKWHTMQGYSYSLSLQVPFVLYLYEERNNFQIKPYKEKITDGDRKKVIDKIDRINNYVEKGELPPKDLNSCKFCKYTDICEKNLNVGDYNED